METTIRQLRSELKEILALVAQGQTVTITCRGKPCAKLVPFGDSADTLSHQEIFGLWKDRDDIPHPTQYVHQQRRKQRAG